MSQATIPAELAEWLIQQNVRDVELAFADVHGFARGKTLPAKAFIKGRCASRARCPSKAALENSRTTATTASTIRT